VGSVAWNLAGYPREAFLRELAEVRQRRAAETEPELRIALSDLIVTAQERRIEDRSPDRGR
jgi:hypothetical protein